MNPLLDLYLYLNDNIAFSDYKKAMDDFEKLWGMNLHIFTENIARSQHLLPLLNYLQKSRFSTYSFLDGVTAGKFNNISNWVLSEFEQKGVNALAVPINTDLINDITYQKFFSKSQHLKLETYLKLSKDNLAYLENIIQFMLSLRIKLCIVDIEKSPRKRNKLSPEEYYSCISRLRKYNNEGNIYFSIIECPYPQDPSTQNTLTKGGCCGGISSCMIDYNGNILPCHYLQSFVQGNIIHNRLYDIWRNSILFDQLRRREENIKGSCAKCKFLTACGGCRAESFYASNSLFLDDPYCTVKFMETSDARTH